MASRKENLKALFSNSRTRVILLITAAIILSVVIFGIVKLRGPTTPDTGPAGRVIGAPSDIMAIPGTGDPSPEYAALIRQENLRQYEAAQRTGGSAIPTLLRGDIGAQAGAGVPGEAQTGVGFAALAREQDLGIQRSLWLQSLQDANCSRTAVQTVLNEGASLALVKEVCSCAILKDNGYGIDPLDTVCSCAELRQAGFNARQFKEAGYDALRLKKCGFDACQLRNAGFSAQQLKDAGFSDGELRGAGYPQNEIDQASGLPPGITADDVRRAGCSPEALARLRQAGVSAAAILRMSGCSPAQLKAGGYTAADLRNAGLTAAQLRRAGFTPEELAQAGYSARDLLNAGLTPEELARAGFTPQQINAAEAELPPGITAADIRNAGCSKEALQRLRAAGVSAKLIRQHAGCSAQALRSAGFTDRELTNAGFTPQQIRDAGAVSDDAIKAAGCDPAQLRQLREAGVSAQKIRELNGCSARALKDAGFGPEALQDAGFTPQELLDAGFTAQQLSRAGLNPVSTLAKGRETDCSVESLRAAREAGVSASTIRSTLGCSAKAMRDAGYTAQELKDAGYTAAQLKDAGFTADELKDAGFSAKELLDAGFTPTELKDAGFSAAELKEAGVTARQLLDAGFSPAELKDAGFTAEELKNAGLSAQQLKDAGFTPAELKEAGFSAQQLKDAGFSARELRDAGFSADALKEAGFSAAELVAAGFILDPTEVAAPPRPDGTAAPGDTIPPMDVGQPPPPADDAVNRQLQQLMKQQQQQVADQRFDQKIQQRVSQMSGAANQVMQQWSQVSTQTYVQGEADAASREAAGDITPIGTAGRRGTQEGVDESGQPKKKALMMKGDIIFAVIDTSVNTDQPGPVLASVVSGRFKGAKLIGSFTPPNAYSDKVTLTFNTMSVPGMSSSTSISAIAIDPNTARTALASRVDKHYFYRYGSMFAASFLEGFGNAFQSANTNITIGGTGGGDNVTIAEGINRSALENAVIGLATVGKAWGQVAQQNVNRPPTVEIFSGTGIGVLFTQDLTSLNS
ncbi:MAG: type IVB secretion system protein DotG/IcmE [Legionellaceae bacterium]|nr:type IVB secretion system protein DotG/IcmE [Legionellaceae bacterium]